jgi:hypothetical protein
MTRSQRSIQCAAMCTALACTAAQAQVVAQKDRFGDIMRFGLPLAAAALSGYERDIDGLKELGESLVLSQGATELLKHTVHSKRPDGTGHGFPSGHASAVFTAATYVQERYSLQWSLPFYALAAATAEERVRKHHHFTKDVVAGALIGSGSSWLLTDRFTGPRSGTSVWFMDGTLVVGYTKQW